MTSTMNFGDDKLRAGAGGGSAVGHSVGDRTGLEPRQEVPLPREKRKREGGKGKKREKKEETEKGVD